MRLLLFLFLFNAGLNAQTFSFKLRDYTNGNQGPMKGVPGDLFMSTLTFSNSSASTIYVVMDRYKNDHPPYWAICYCYIQCHTPAEDSILIEIQPFSTTDVSVQFKTDSVNPGIAYNSFNIYQTGFQNNVQKLDMTASTLSSVGIKENRNAGNFSFGPNPASNNLRLTSPFTQGSIQLYDALGNLKGIYKIESTVTDMNVTALPAGIYLLQVESMNQTTTKRLIKE